MRTFGSYIDTYSIEQAVRDGATVPIFYESRLPELQIIGQTLDQLFNRTFADRSDQERAAIKRRYATEPAIAGAPRRVEAICLNLLEHFTKCIAPNRFKAQLVATNRHTAVAYQETLDRLDGPESAVIMSVHNNDAEPLARWHLSRQQQDRLIERFKDRDDPLSILIVCDMLLTGFDAPAEQVMYLDAPLKEHRLLQAIARVNRPCGEGKTSGLVVDYRGVSTRLQEAPAIFSTTEVRRALVPKADESPPLESRHAGADQPAQVRAALISWLRRHAEERLLERVDAWRMKAGVSMPQVLVADQRKRWGSCDQGGTIRLNWRTIQAPMRLVDYVVVHELTHLLHRRRGREYWQSVGRFMPGYERRREELRELGGRLMW